MLKNIDPLLNAEMLYALQAMGHGDTLAIVDANYHAESAAAHTVSGNVLHMEGVSITRAIEAVLSLLPLDSFVDDAARTMEIVGRPGEVPPVHVEMQAAIDKAEGKPWPMVPVERMAFYEEARKAYCIIATGERRFYGNVIFRKGVIAP